MRQRFITSLVIGVATWPVATLKAGLGIDPSWWAALNMGAHRRMAFGTDLAFTYGPLGFLNKPVVYYGWTGVAALAFAAAVWFTAAFVLLHVARRNLSEMAAAAVTAVLLLLLATITAELVEVFAVVFALVVLARIADAGADDAPAAPTWWFATAGAIAAAVVLIKFNAGALCAVLVVVWTLLAPDRSRRAVVAAGGAFVVALSGLWLVTVGDLGALPTFVSRSIAVALGYSEAMAGEDAPRWHYIAVPALLAVFAVTFYARARPPRRVAVPLALVGLLFVAAELKRGFVRHGPGHAAMMFFALATIPLAVRFVRRNDRALLAALACALLTFAAAAPARDLVVTELARRPARVFTQWATMLDPSARAEARDEMRAAMRAELDLHPATVRAIGRHGVHIDPWETAAVWAYDLRWQPVPVFQTYSAYTPGLDSVNAGALRGVDRPERILRRGNASPIDGRVPLFESPEYMFEMVCRYGVELQDGDWYLLKPRPNRCGRSRVLGSQHVGDGEQVTVPSLGDGEMIVAAIRFEPNALARAVAAAVKPVHEPRITLDGKVFRFVAATADGPLMLQLPPQLGWDFRLAGGPTSVEHFVVSGAGGYTVEFRAVAVA